MLFVPKRQESGECCIDYRMLNPKTLKNDYPLPKIQDCVDKLDKTCRLSMLVTKGTELCDRKV